MKCLTDSQVILFLDTALPAHETANVETHLDGCPACRKLIVAMVQHSRHTAKVSGQNAASSLNSDEHARLLSTVTTGSTNAVIVQFLQGSVIANRYLVLDAIGTGASGVVYSAYDRKLDRKLALKFLTASPYDQLERGQSRLLREGQSLARLSHPNVVSVYDVGSFDGYNYIAMELVEGCSLRQWLAEKQPDWRRTAAVFLEAGRGLLAAHGARLVHRDFKPDNVLIGRDGRVRVSDFGFSHALSGAATPAAEKDGVPLSSNAAFRLSTIAGTPAYMAPEQYHGQPIDGRADQFSFCVALYEALYGVHPFPDDTYEGLRQAVCEGRVRTPPRGRSVPSFLHNAVLRGLRPSPQARYETMAPLCDVLGRVPRRRRLPFGVGLGVALLLGTIGTAWQLRSKPCQNAAAYLDGVWDEPRTQAVMRAFAKSGMPYAPAARLRIREQLDAYAARWLTARTEACEAANVRHEISPALLDQRIVCLEHRLHELRVTIGVLSLADAAVTERAEQMVTQLRSVEDCTAAAVASSRVPLPSPELLFKVRALQDRLNEVRVLEQAGLYTKALELARAAKAEAEALGYLPLLAETEISLGTIEDRTGDPGRALSSLRKALTNAEASQHDEAVLAAWLGLARVTAYSNSQFELAADYLEHAEAFMARAGTDRARADLFELQAALLRKSGKFREARAASERALSSASRAYGADSPHVATALSRLASLEILLGDVETGMLRFAQARLTAERTLSPMHPGLIPILQTYGGALLHVSRYGEALAQLQRALDIAEQVYPLTHMTRQTCLFSLVVAKVFAGHDAEGELLAQRWLTLDQGASTHDPSLVLGTLQCLARAQKRQGRPSEAMATLRRALAKAGELHVEGSLIGEIFTQQGDYELDAGQVRIAFSHYQKAVALQEKSIPDRPEFGAALTGIGKVYLSRKEWEKAVLYLERALPTYEKIREDSGLQGGPHFALAQALMRSGGDRARARKLAEEAQAVWQRCGDPCRTELAAVRKWLIRLPEQRQPGA